jgi:DNA-binding transcriptional ArsR family regulator
MSKLRVGDILIEDDRISAPGILVPPTSDGQAQQSSGPAGLITWIAGLRAPSGVLAWTGTGLVVVGLALEIAAWPWNNPVRALLRGGLLVPVGAALIGLALARTYLNGNPTRMHRLLLGSSADELLDRLVALLAPGSKHQTVEWIQTKMAASEQTVVRLLAVLREDGLVSEEFDSDSGDFYYRIIRQDPQDLDERLAKATNRRR